MKITVDLNALFILGSTAPLFHNNKATSVYVKVTDGTTPLAMDADKTFNFPLTAVAKTYDVFVFDGLVSDAYEVAPGETCYVHSVPTNKMIAYTGLEDSVFYKEICNNVNIRTVGDQLTGGLTLIAAGLGILNIGTSVANAKVTCDHMDDDVIAAIAAVCGPVTAELVAEELEGIGSSTKHTVLG